MRIESSDSLFCKKSTSEVAFMSSDRAPTSASTIGAAVAEDSRLDISFL